MARLESPCFLSEDGFQGKLIKKQARELDGPLGLSFPLKKPPLANLGRGVSGVAVLRRMFTSIVLPLFKKKYESLFYRTLSL